MEQEPLISIIMATYNRSNIISYSIKTVISQTYQNWELIVVGDHCTDDTEAVVLSFNDTRITFINLSKNFGEQSGPNNHGLKLAKGDLISFLNHDDLWFNDHLENSVRLLRNDSSISLAYSWWLSAGGLNNKKNKIPFDPGLGYRLKVPIPASAWLFYKKIVEDIGYWKSFRELYLAPSQDWLIRVYKSGHKIKSTGFLSLIAIPSGGRKNSYKDRHFDENKYWFEKLKEPDKVRIELFSEDAINLRRELEGTLSLVFLSVKNLIKQSLVMINVSPSDLRKMLLYRKKGAFLNKLRKTRGLKEIE